ncbi:MAG: class I SAM-dependent methyltransferase, partial [Planctomycetaceae bacterium]|nr:class I SAM-dependent methyltransferase [Planctomycetaceae bacterium]
GMRIGDVGSGTGLYLAPFSQAVGENGRVFAIDISPRLIEHIQKRVASEKMANVAVVRSTEKSITLPEDSVDRIFICDTYHHFEYHVAMLESIRSALSPEGELIVIDFERIPGKSREWTLNHVRAGKDQVRKEIEAAGFTFVEEVKIPEFSENYLLRFRR